ncbi:MAG: class I SAM-dependent methyltransferase [Chloroflexi bacterium]|nr:MAG: class I SAM-dependent methyltransferase [Chloroflexota bacterium]
MPNARQRIAFLGSLTAAILFAAWRVYERRFRERVVSHEALDDLEIARAFNRIARLPQFGLMRWFVARRAAAMVPAGHAADLGCGPGYLVVKLAQVAPGLHVTGVDLADEMLVEAERVARRSGLQDRADFKQGDVAQLPFPNGSLDLVVSTLSLHHWTDPVGVLDEIARVLRPGGSFLVADLRRDMSAPFYMLLWFATHCVVPRALRRINEPMGSRNAAFTPQEAAHLVAQSRLAGWRVTHGPLWLTIEGTRG